MKNVISLREKSKIVKFWLIYGWRLKKITEYAWDCKIKNSSNLKCLNDIYLTELSEKKKPLRGFCVGKFGW